MISASISYGAAEADPITVQVDTDADYTTAIAADLCRLALQQLHDAVVALSDHDPLEPEPTA